MAKWRMEWRVGSKRDLAWGGVPIAKREVAFALAGQRYANSDQPQIVWNIVTQERWSVGYETRQQKPAQKVGSTP